MHIFSLRSPVNLIGREYFLSVGVSFKKVLATPSGAYEESEDKKQEQLLTD
jgi:hypothetical protein